MMRSVIMHEDTAALSVVLPEALARDAEQLLSEQDRAVAAGRSAGYEKGRAEAKKQLAAEAERARTTLDSALHALNMAIVQMQTALDLERQRLEHLAVDLAFGVAEAVVSRELTLSHSPGLEAIERALAAAPSRNDAVVRLHPTDAQTILDHTRPHGVTTIVSDPSVSPGGCLLEVGATLVDAQVETALARVRMVLNEATEPR
jgi:flagellar assembly protein FliH